MGLDCFLPTRKVVDDIYRAAVVKLEPVPMYALRDSAVTMYHHNLIVEGQRKLRKGLVAGIKKDVVISGRIPRDPKPNQVAIYGWHKLDGEPIQPLYTGHVKLVCRLQPGHPAGGSNDLCKRQADGLHRRSEGQIIEGAIVRRGRL